ncbi:MAG: 50S ribosomal protein L19 [Minisyncoccia bacterium]
METIKSENVKPGMYLRVYQKIKEKDKERIQRIEGIVLSRKHGNEPGATFTVRRIIKGVGVEWILPVHSPTIEKVELIKAAKTRRAKLYYIREKSQKETRKKLKTTLKTKKPEEKLEEVSQQEKENP